MVQQNITLFRTIIICDLPCHAEVAGTENSHPSMWQCSKYELVETEADLPILPQWKRVQLICVTEASDQLHWPKVPHPSTYFAAILLKKKKKKKKKA